MIVKTPGSQMGSPAAADKGGEEMGGVCTFMGKQSFKDPFRHIKILSQKLARSVAAHSAKSVLFRPHAEI